MSNGNSESAQLQGGNKRSASEYPILAILPFVDLSPGKVEGHFCEGIAEEILIALCRVEGLRLLSRTSSFLHKDSTVSALELGRQLRVDALLIGAIRKEDARLRLDAEMLDVRTGEIAWLDRFDRKFQDVFQIVEEIAHRIASSLHLELESSSVRRPVDLEAYDRYLKGRQLYFQYNRHSMQAAMAMFKEALDLDPSYAAAWAGLANCATFFYIYVDRSEVYREYALRASQKALDLDPDLAEAHAARGVALSSAGNAEEAEEAFEKALRLDPYLYEAAYFYARHCFSVGKREQAIEFFEQAAAMRPEDCQAILLVAQVYHSLGIEDEAETARRRGLALAEARLERDPKDARTRYLGANALVALGEREIGLEWARMARSLDPDDSMLLYNLGCIHALAADPEEALECLDRSISAGLTQKDWFLQDGDLESIRSLPRFQALLERLG